MSWTPVNVVDGSYTEGEEVENQFTADLSAGMRLFADATSYGNPGGDNDTYIFDSIEDDAGNDWAPAGDLVRSTANLGHIGQIFTCIHNGAVARPTVTVGHNRAAGHPGLALALAAWVHDGGADAGVAGHNERGNQTSPGTGDNAVTANQVTATEDDSLIHAFCTAEDVTNITAGTGYTLSGADHLFGGSSYGRGEYRIVNAGAYTPTFKLGTNRAVLAMGVVISPPAGGGGTPQEGEAADIAESSDSAAATKDASASLTDIAESSDAAVAASSSDRTATDGAVSSDAAVGSVTALRSLSDIAVASEDLATIHKTAGTPEVAVASDAPDARQDAIQRPSDSAVSSDASVGSRGTHRTAADIAFASDSPRGVWAGTAMVSDIAEALDVAVRAGAQEGDVTDIAVASDAPATRAAFRATPQDIALATDLPAAVVTALGTQSDIAMASDELAGIAAFIRGAQDIAVAFDIARPFARLHPLDFATGPAAYEPIIGSALRR